jgi:hypothetical protein
LFGFTEVVFRAKKKREAESQLKYFAYFIACFTFYLAAFPLVDGRGLVMLIL